MNRTRSKVLALFCSLLIIATCFITPSYQDVLATDKDPHIWEVVPEDGQLVGTTEESYCFKVYGHVGTSISKYEDRKMIIDFKDKDGNWHTITLEDIFNNGDNIKYVSTDFFPTEYQIAAGGGGSRTYTFSIAILDWTGQESAYIHKEHTYWVSTPHRSGNTESLTPKISNRSYVNVYTPENNKTVVAGRIGDKGNIDIEGNSDVKLLAKTYAIDQYGFRYEASNKGYKLTNKTTGENINFKESTSEYMLSGKRAYDDEEYYISTFGSIDDKEVIEIQSKSFIVNNQLVAITFNANGGTFPDGSTLKQINQRFYHNYNLPEKNPTKPGYEFAGWGTQSLTGGGVIDANTLFLGKGGIALWVEGKYTITLKGVKNGLAENSKDWTENEGGVYTYAKQFTSKTGDTVTLPDVKADKEGHAFKGWYKVSQYGYCTGPAIKEIDLSLQDNWRDINIVAVYETELLPSVLILDKGDAPTAPDSPIFVTGSGNESITVTKKDCEVFEDLYEGHDFVGLKYIDKGGSEKEISKDTLNIGAQISPKFEEKANLDGQKGFVATATAQYKAKTYTVTKDKNYEDNNVKRDSQTVIFGKSYNLGTPTRDNYEFKGWNTEADGTGLTIPTEGTVDTSFKDLTVYAQWELKNVRVTYVYGYDGENKTELMISPGQPYVFPEEASIEGTTIHWFDDTGNEVSAYDDVPLGVTSMQLRAKYSFPITLNYGYYNKVSQHTVTYGEKYNLPDLEGKRNGWNFVGWYNRTKYIDPEATVKIKPEENTTLVGKWSPTVQVQMQESVTTIVDSFGEVEVDENDIPMYKMSAVGLDKEEVYQAVKLLLVLRHKYPNIDVSNFIDESKGWLETLRSKISTKHHESEGLEVKGLEWFIKMTAAVKTENDDLWEEMSSRIDRNQILKLYDVELLDIIKELNYEPSTGAVTLRIPIPENIDDYQDAVLFHYNKVKNEMEYLDYEVKDGFYEVQLTSFSPIGIAANTKFGKAAATGDKIPSLLSAGALLAGLGISIMFKKKKDENDLHR